MWKLKNINIIRQWYYSCITRTRRWRYSTKVDPSFDFKVAVLCHRVCPGITNISQCSLVTRVQLNMTSRVSITPVADHNGPVFRSYFLSSSHSYSNCTIKICCIYFVCVGFYGNFSRYPSLLEYLVLPLDCTLKFVRLKNRTTKP